MSRRAVGLAVLVAMAALWVGIWLQLAGSPLVRVAMIDERHYTLRAQEIATGGGVPAAPTFMSPLYPALLWLTGSAVPLDDQGVILGQPPLGIHLLQAVLWCAIVFMLWSVARRGLPVRWAWIPPLLFALYRPATAMASTLLLEIPYTFCVVAALWVLTREPGASRWWARAVLVGALVGLAVLLRGVAVALLVAVAVGWVWQRGSLRKAAAPLALSILATAVVTLPAVVHNSQAAGRLVGPSLNGGLVLYIGNGPQADGFQATGRDYAFDQDPTGRTWLARVTGEKPHDPAAVDRAWRDAALSAMADEPGRAAGLWAKKVWLHVIAAEIPNVTPLQAWGGHSAVMAAMVVPFGALSALGLAGLALVGWRAGPWRLWTLALGSLVVLQSVFYVISRYRIELVPVLALLAGAYLHELVRRRGRARLAALGVLVLAVLAVQPWGERGYLFRLESAAIAGEASRWQALGSHQLATGDRAAAQASWARSIALFQQSVARTPTLEAYRKLARSQAASGAPADAVGTLAEAMTRLPDDRLVLQRDRIRLLLSLRQAEAALAELTSYLQQRPDDLEMRHWQVVLLARAGREAEAVPLARAMVAGHPDEVLGYRDLAMLLMNLGQLDEAATVLADGRRRFPTDPDLRRLVDDLERRRETDAQRP
jgi:tetratricopeptide (TPR) repeat protein